MKQFNEYANIQFQQFKHNAWKSATNADHKNYNDKNKKQWWQTSNYEWNILWFDKQNQNEHLKNHWNHKIT